MSEDIIWDTAWINALREFFDTECFLHDWEIIAIAMNYEFGINFTADSCKKYYLEHLTKRSPFTRNEDKKLAGLVKKYADWNKIASEMKGRTSKECRERWQDYLNPNLSSKWPQSEDKTTCRRSGLKHGILENKTSIGVKKLNRNRPSLFSNKILRATEKSHQQVDKFTRGYTKLVK